MDSSINIATKKGEFQAFLARPAVASAPAVVLLHEVFGVNDDMRATCAELADRGFIALCPDLFWRQQRGTDLSTWSDAEWKKGLELYTAYNRDTGVDDVLAAVAAARALPGSNGKVAVMGFCLGGLMAFLAAARGSVDAVVAYHGGDTERYLDEAPRIAAPMIMHLAEEDEFISKAAQADIKAVLVNKDNVRIYSYAGCHHAFARHTGAHYDHAAAALANGRTWSFLSKVLRGQEPAGSELPTVAGA